MKLIINLLLLFVSSLSFATSWIFVEPIEDETPRNITCYPKADDQDNDGYAKEGSVAKKFPKEKDYQCPANYVIAADDCDDRQTSIHPYKSEIAFNSQDDNCDGAIDENEFIYFSDGLNNTNKSYDIRVKINDSTLINYSEYWPIYAKVFYRDITRGVDAERSTDYLPVSFGNFQHPWVGNYKGTTLSVSRLPDANYSKIYRNNVKFYFFYQFNSADTENYHEITQANSNLYYTATRLTTNKLIQARSSLALRAFTELFYQHLGLLGKNGSEWINGTRYAADVNDQWCTEFYSFVTHWNLRDSYPLDHSTKMVKYFGNNFFKITDGVNLSNARLGDYLAFDFSNDTKTDHSAMFLGVHQDGRIVTAEGNAGNRVKIRYRNLDDIYGYGKITTDILK
jgi:Putative metal-binding motif